MSFVLLGVAIWLDSSFWWWTAGLFAGGSLATVIWVLDDPPEHVAKWGRGAAGERRTAKELEALAREGWLIEHDRQLDRGNLDHIAVGPPGRFLIETKTSTGAVQIDEGVFTVTFADDPDERFTNASLHRRVKAHAAELARMEPGGGWVHAVVVIWGAFPQGLIHHDHVTYLEGSRLLSHLRNPFQAAERQAS
jgi:hypothetical protein